MRAQIGRLARLAGAAALLAACSAPERDAPRQNAPRGDIHVTSRSAPVLHPRFDDTDPHDWSGRGPRAYPVHGIDVSRWQRSVNWRRARAAGVAFAYIKATEGGDHVDPMFRTHWEGAKRAGVRHGAYHYFYFCRPAAQQARWFIANVPRDTAALPHVLDMEWTPHSPTCRDRPDSAKIRAEAKRFLDILERHYGRRPILYTTVDFYRHTDIGRLPNTQFWLRSVAGHPRQTFPGARWTFWQYTGTGIVPGIEGEVDINVFAGSPEAWIGWPG